MFVCVGGSKICNFRYTYVNYRRPLGNSLSSALKKNTYSRIINWTLRWNTAAKYSIKKRRNGFLLQGSLYRCVYSCVSAVVRERGAVCAIKQSIPSRATVVRKRCTDTETCTTNICWHVSKGRLFWIPSARPFVSSGTKTTFESSLPIHCASLVPALCWISGVERTKNVAELFVLSDFEISCSVT